MGYFCFKKNLVYYDYMKQKILEFLLVVVFIVLTMFYYSNSFGAEVDKTFITLSTFLFALFTGFFISRQSGRYGEIRKLTADFDGTMSATYRAMGHFGDEAQNKAGEIIKNHYENILKHGWDYPFMNKTTTITDLHKLMEETVKINGLDGIKGSVATRNMLGLQDLQKIRKNLVALREERIPTFQWLLVFIVALILITTVSTLVSENFLLSSLIKSAFVSSVLVAVILLKQLDSLKLFSGSIGENSAKDVVNIISGKK
jgi:hypothetical protein